MFGVCAVRAPESERERSVREHTLPLRMAKVSADDRRLGLSSIWIRLVTDSVC